MLEIDNLVAGYGKVQVLQGLSLKVEKGQLVTLIGSNGAGKTTTLRAVSGMIRPESGRIQSSVRSALAPNAMGSRCLSCPRRPPGSPAIPCLSTALLHRMPPR